MATDLSGLKIDERNFAPDQGQKAIPVYADKLNDVIDNIETEQNLKYTTDGTIVSGQEPKVEYGDEVYHRTVIEGTFVSIADANLPDGALTGATLAFGQKIFDFPQGGIHVCGAVFDLTLTTDDFQGHTAAAYIGLGTVQATGATAALEDTWENIVDGYSGGVTASTGGADYHRVAAAESDAKGLDGTTTAIDMYLNVAGDWHNATGTYVVAGKISFNWSFLGDIPL